MSYLQLRSDESITLKIKKKNNITLSKSGLMLIDILFSVSKFNKKWNDIQ